MEDQDPLAERPGGGQFVGDDHQRQAKIPAHLIEHLEHRGLHVGIEAGGGFIEDQYLGFHQQRPGQDDSSQLPAAQLEGAVLQPFGCDVDHLQDRSAAPITVGPVRPDGVDALSLP